MNTEEKLRECIREVVKGMLPLAFKHACRNVLRDLEKESKNNEKILKK